MAPFGDWPTNETITSSILFGAILGMIWQ